MLTSSTLAVSDESVRKLAIWANTLCKQKLFGTKTIQMIQAIFLGKQNCIFSIYFKVNNLSFSHVEIPVRMMFSFQMSRYWQWELQLFHYLPHPACTKDTVYSFTTESHKIGKEIIVRQFISEKQVEFTRTKNGTKTAFKLHQHVKSKSRNQNIPK